MALEHFVLYANQHFLTLVRQPRKPCSVAWGKQVNVVLPLWQIFSTSVVLTVRHCWMVALVAKAQSPRYQRKIVSAGCASHVVPVFRWVTKQTRQSDGPGCFSTQAEAVPVSVSDSDEVRKKMLPHANPKAVPV
jgi:hypothetical protein